MRVIGIARRDATYRKKKIAMALKAERIFKQPRY